MSEKLKAILDVANNAYEKGELRINEDLQRGERGDGLADFIATELAETCLGSNEWEMGQIAISALSRSVEQLQSVIDALATDFGSDEYIDVTGENEDEVAGHTVRWYVQDYADVDNDEIKSITDLDESSIEHLTEKLVDGYREGELVITIYPDGNESADPVCLRGWWHKV